MKQISVIAALLLSFASKAQVVINITSDTTFATTFQCSTNTIINGNGKKVAFLGFPKFYPIGCTLLIKNMSVPDRANWSTSTLCNALEWKNIDGMTGYMYNVSSCTSLSFDKTKYLDGTSK